jgi:hypothetical protein
MNDFQSNTCTHVEVSGDVARRLLRRADRRRGPRLHVCRVLAGQARGELAALHSHRGDARAPGAAPGAGPSGAGGGDRDGSPLARRTNADKRRAVLMLLRDDEWGKRADRWVAERCGVGYSLVATLRTQLPESGSSGRARLGQDGKVRRLPAKAAAKPTSERAAAQPATAVAATLAKVIELLAEQDENEVRKEFTPSERVSIVEAIRAHIGNRAGRPSKNIPENSRELPKGVDTIEFAAAKGGFGNDFTYRQAKSVVDRGTPELVRAMDSGALSINMASKLAERPHADQQRIATAVLSGEDARNALRELHRDEPEDSILRRATMRNHCGVIRINALFDSATGEASMRGHGARKTRGGWVQASGIGGGAHRCVLSRSRARASGHAAHPQQRDQGAPRAGAQRRGVPGRADASSQGARQVESPRARCPQRVAPAGVTSTPGAVVQRSVSPMSNTKDTKRRQVSRTVEVRS